MVHLKCNYILKNCKIIIVRGALWGMQSKRKFVCLLMTFINSLGPDQARQNVWPDLDPNCLTL